MRFWLRKFHGVDYDSHWTFVFDLLTATLKMTKRYTIGLGVFLILSFAGAAIAAVGGGPIPQHVAERYGLKRAWFSQADVDPGIDRLVHITLHTKLADSFTIHEVTTAAGERFVFSERDRDSFGRPLGKDGAKAFAIARAEELTAAGAKPTHKERSIAQTSLFVQSERGTVHAFDAETGRSLWALTAGRRDYPTSAVGANDDYAAVVNGTTLYVYDRNTGQLAWERRMGGAPTAGPALTKDYVYVPMANGRVEGYKLASHREPAWAYKSPGQVFVQPTVTPRSITWPTSEGYLYISRANEPAVRFRLETRDAVVAPPTYKAPLIYAASRSGYVYAMHELSGAVRWRYATGAPINEQPVAIGDVLYVCPEDGGMFCLTLDIGKQVWWTPRASRFVAASENRVYAIDVSGGLVVIDAKTGAQLDRLGLPRATHAVVNEQTDRIYLGSSAGMVQCLRELGQAYPIVHVTTFVEDDSKAKPKTKKPEATEEAPAADDAKPAENETPAVDDAFKSEPAADAKPADAPKEMSRKPRGM
jgi:outer membrane protein assembly factor BamB